MPSNGDGKPGATLSCNSFQLSINLYSSIVRPLNKVVSDFHFPTVNSSALFKKPFFCIFPSLCSLLYLVSRPFISYYGLWRYEAKGLRISLLFLLLNPSPKSPPPTDFFFTSPYLFDSNFESNSVLMFFLSTASLSPKIWPKNNHQLITSLLKFRLKSIVHLSLSWVPVLELIRSHFIQSIWPWTLTNNPKILNK